MNTTTFSMYFVVTLLMILSPGPAVFLAMGHGLRYGVRGGMLGAIGIEIMNSLYFVVSALGLTATLLAYPSVFAFLKWGGIIYLVVTGVRIVFYSKERSLVPVATTSDKRLVVQGVLTQAANPKAVIYFGAMLPQFIVPNESIGFQCLILGVTGCVMEFIILTAYAWLAFRGSKLLPGPTAILWHDRIAGFSLTTVAAVLAFR